MKLILQIAAGFALGQLLWELLGILVDWLARVTGRIIALLQLMVNWQRAVLAQRKADEQAREIVKE